MKKNQWLTVIKNKTRHQFYRGDLESFQIRIPPKFIDNPWQVATLRDLLGAPQDDRSNHLDGYGMKVLFNHGIRRFLTGAKNKEPSAKLLYLRKTDFISGFHPQPFHP